MHSSRATQLQNRPRTRIVSATGRVRNDHFLLTADHLLLDVNPASLQLVAAFAEGNVQVHMLGAPSGGEFVIFGESAVYQAGRKRIVLAGWKGTLDCGVRSDAECSHREVLLPVDGSFFQGGAEPASAPVARQEERGVELAA